MNNQNNPNKPLKVPLIIFGIPFHNVSFETTLSWIKQTCKRRKSCLMATANLDFALMASHDPEMKHILLEADLCVADGMPIVWASGLLGPRLKERVTGSDLVPLIARMASKEGLRLFLLGGAEGVAEAAAKKLKKDNPKLEICGIISPANIDFLNINNADILAQLNASKPDILLVALGAPKQEKWIRMNLKSWNIPLAIGVGASFDFLAGIQKRSPKFLGAIGLEWIWRLGTAPKRLAKRYSKDLLFLVNHLLQLLTIRLSPKLRYVQNSKNKIVISEYNGVSLTLHSIHDTTEAEKEMSRLIKLSSHKHMVIYPENDGWLNSAELGILLYLSNKCRYQKKHMILIIRSKRMDRLIHLQKLNTYFDCVTQYDEAIDILASKLNDEIRIKEQDIWKF
ncbi:MAG: WecB/TagA/CpsF family glycosyltransferase [Lentisphaeria bacterium]|nr:WecB/TagA/CpsF family glycosyltransferase [Lentisphaeria bacterium]